MNDLSCQKQTANVYLCHKEETCVMISPRVDVSTLDVLINSGQIPNYDVHAR